VPAVFCAKCGRKWATDDRFCAGCGAPKPDGQPASKPDPTVGAAKVDRQGQAIAGLVLGILAVIGTITLPSVLTSDEWAPGPAILYLLGVGVVGLGGLLFGSRGRRSRLFGTAVGGMVLGLLSSIVAGVVVIATCSANNGPQPTSSGAFFTIVSYQYAGSCTPTTCPVSATVRNDGHGAGSATVTFYISDSRSSAVYPNGHALTRNACDTDSPKVPGETANVTCELNRSGVSGDSRVWLYAQVTANR
jgi:hypothetical protein